MVEAGMVLYNKKVISVSRGQPCSVEFDFEKVWAFKKETPNFDPLKLRWLHVHPASYGTQPSSTDLNCARGLRAAFGKIGWFGIVCFENDSLDSFGGEVRWYWLKGRELVEWCELPLLKTTDDARDPYISDLNATVPGLVGDSSFFEGGKVADWYMESIRRVSKSDATFALLKAVAVSS